MTPMRTPLTQPILLAAVAVTATASDATAGPTPETSVLRVNVTSQGFNFRLPWQKTSPSSQSTLGPFLEGDKILVTASAVANATYVELEKPVSGEKLTAKVEGVDYEANLAVIVPEGEPGSFFEGMVPIGIGTEVALGDDVDVWQFESNGSSVSTTLVIDNFDIGNYFLENSFFLIYQAAGTLQFRDSSAALPVVKDGKLVGLHIDYSSGDEISDIIPGSIIKHFLDDLATPPYRGFPNFGIKYARTLDEQFRSFAKLNGHEGGIYVSAVIPGTSAHASGIKVGDVILEINGHAVDSRGNYDDPRYGVLSISNLVKGDVFAGDTIGVKLLRDGEEETIDVTLVRKQSHEYLIDPYMFDRGPKYLVMGGLLFQELTVPFLKTVGDKWRTRAPFKLVYAQANQEIFEEDGREKLVFLSGTLPTRSALGYERLSAIIVDKVNGKKINKIADLDAAFSEIPENGIHTIELADFPHKIFLDHAAAERDNAELLPARYRIFQLKRLD